VTADDTQLGVQLARLCVDAGIPATYLAALLKTTRMTVYSWFRGQDIRKKHRPAVRALVDLMRKDFEEGLLPTKSLQHAREYIEALAGDKI
jgi:hypothetical protein